MATSNQSAPLPYLGSKISLLSNSDIRYEGILYTINTQESTVALQNVRSFGTEGRKTPDIPPSREIYDFIIFRGKDIKDITVCEPPLDDPAIVTVNVNPTPEQRLPSQAPAGATGIGLDAPPPQSTAPLSSPYGERFDSGPRIDRVVRPFDRYPQSRPAGVGPMQNARGGGMYGGNQRYDFRNQQRGNVSGSGYNQMSGGYGGASRRYVGNQYNQYYGGRGGGGGGGGGSRGPRQVVGELIAQPNQAVKQQVVGDFDFEVANAKFEKPKEAKRDETEKEGAQIAGYDKTTSFFDNISCETLDRQAGQDAKVDRDKQRLLDSETFGASATQRGRYRGRRGGGYRGRNNYAYGGHSNMMYNGGYSNYQSSYGGYRGFPQRPTSYRSGGY